MFYSVITNLHFRLSNILFNIVNIHINRLYVYVIDEEISYESLLLMTENTLASLVPKMGPRVLLASKIQQVC